MNSIKLKRNENMTFKFKPLIAALALASFSATSAVAAEEAKKVDYGSLSGQVKLQHVVDAKDNGYDPNSGQGWMLQLKYLSPKLANNLRFGITAHSVGDIFKVADTEVVPGEKRPASGLYKPNNELFGDIHSQLSEFYLRYSDKKTFAYAGRKQFYSPLTNSAESTVPDYHTVIGGTYKINKKFKAGLAHINKMSLGTRAANEYGLLGEGTGTGGVTQRTLGTSDINNIAGDNIEVMKFYDISQIALGVNTDEDTAGLTVANAYYRHSKNLNFELWDYYAHDIYNALYGEWTYSTKIKPLKKKLVISGQGLMQTEVGQALAQDTYFGEIDYKMLGIKAEIKDRKWGAYIAMNQSFGDSGFFNAFSGDPGFTSSQFSRNEYREDVTAIKVEGRYTVNPKFIVKASYATYSQSRTRPYFDVFGQYVVPGVDYQSSGITNVEAVRDADETNIKLIFKPMKKARLILTHAIRTSEYDGVGGADLTMAHTRLIGIYNF